MTPNTNLKLISKFQTTLNWNLICRGHFSKINQPVHTGVDHFKGSVIHSGDLLYSSEPYKNRSINF